MGGLEEIKPVVSSIRARILPSNVMAETGIAHRIIIPAAIEMIMPVRNHDSHHFIDIFSQVMSVGEI